MTDGARQQARDNRGRARRAKATTDTIFEVLVVALTVLAALAAYQGALADDRSAGLELEGQNLLSSAESEAARADRALLEQFRLFDGFMAADEGSFAEEYFFFELDDPVGDVVLFNSEASEREWRDPFPPEYVDSFYEQSSSLFVQAGAKFNEAAAEGERALGYQAVVLTFAIGLSFAAWGGLAHEADRRRTRRLFLILAGAATVLGVLQFLAV